MLVERIRILVLLNGAPCQPAPAPTPTKSAMTVRASQSPVPVALDEAAAMLHNFPEDHIGNNCGFFSSDRHFQCLQLHFAVSTCCTGLPPPMDSHSHRSCPARLRSAKPFHRQASPSVPHRWPNVSHCAADLPSRAEEMRAAAQRQKP
eukprot:SAG31_NODE_538_length_14312_cov_12.542461_4_plen_148_part_00